MSEAGVPKKPVFIALLVVAACAVAFVIHLWGPDSAAAYATIVPPVLAGVAVAANALHGFLSRHSRPSESAAKKEAFARKLREYTQGTLIRGEDFPKKYAKRHHAYQEGRLLPPRRYLDTFIAMYEEIDSSSRGTVAEKMLRAWQDAHDAISRKHRSLLIGVGIPSFFFAIAAILGLYFYTYRPPVSTWTRQLAGPVDGRPFVVGSSVYVASDGGDVYDLDASTGRINWKANVGHYGDSSPYVSNGILYIGSRDSGNVYALEAATGKSIWAYHTHSIIESSPVVADGLVYIGSEDGRVYALKPSNGQLLWQRYVGGPVEGVPAFSQGKVYVGSMTSNHKAGYVSALKAETGDIVWQEPTGPIDHSSPFVADEKVYVGSTNRRVYQLSAVTGRIRWISPTAGAVDSNPTVVNGDLYIGDNDGNLYVLNAATGTAAGTYETSYYVSSNPVVHKGIVYFGSDDDNIYALTATTDPTYVWKHLTGGHVECEAWVTGAGALFIGSDDGKVYALNATTGR
jgi:outer membrane protein assembly factor BamB